MRTASYPTQLQFNDLATHFLALNPGDRFLRFGWAISDWQIVAYLESLVATRDSVFVVDEPDQDISGVLHLEPIGGGVTLGLSVSAWARKMGIGTLLLRQAGEEARARGLTTLFVRNLNLNSRLRRLAHRLGMRVACVPSAAATRLEAPTANHDRLHRDTFDGDITLADDSLRLQWNGQPAGAALLEPPHAIS